MLLALCLLQASVLVRPLHRSEAPPPVRAAQVIQIMHADVTGIPAGHPASSRPRASGRSLARQLAAALARGADFEELAARHSDGETARRGAVLGSFARGDLPPALDAFLFAAGIGETSEPIELASGFYILRRVEAEAAVRQILVRAKDEEGRARAASLLEDVRRGADFRDLARRYSEDPRSAERGGDYQVFERGPGDRLLKKAAFEAEVGEVVGPIETPLGLHLLQRVPVSKLAPSLRERTWVRATAILIACADSVEPVRVPERTNLEAREIAFELHRRAIRGEDLGELAEAFTDDPGGRGRKGDLGWIHRQNPDLPAFVERLFVAPVGELREPLPTTAGWVLLRRDV